MLRRPRKLSASLRERTNPNDPEIFVCDVASHRTSAGQSFVAVDGVRFHGRIADFVSAKKPGAHSLLALAGSIGEIPDSLFATGQPWKPSVMVTHFPSIKSWVVPSDGGGQPTLHSSNCLDSHAHCLSSFPGSASFASGASYSSLALRFRSGSLRLGHAVAAGFCGHAGRRAITGGTRSGSAASAGTCWRSTEADRNVGLSDFFRTGDLWHSPASFDMA